MAAHRYWQIINLDTYGVAGLDITGVHLLANTTRVDTTATLTSSIAPATGSLANLQDDDTTTGATWLAAQVRGLVLSWDFGAGGDVDVTDIRLGSSTDIAKFLLSARMQYADTLGTWTDAARSGALPPLSGIAWPGARAKTSSIARGVWNVVDLSTLMTVGKTRDVAICLLGGSPRFIRGVSLAQTGVRQFEVSTTGGDNNQYVGVGTSTASSYSPPYAGAENWVFSLNNGYKGNANVLAAYATSSPAVAVIGVVLDSATGSLTFYKNGVSLGVAYTGVSGIVYPLWGGVNQFVGYTATLRTSGFTYPVAGALPWDDQQTIATTTGAKAFTDLPRVPSAMSIALPYGQVRVPTVIKGRNSDAATGLLGKGIGRVRGTVKNSDSGGVPVYRRVRLVRMTDGLQLREMWSDPVTGAYDFQWVDELQSYVVMAFDHTLTYRAVIADRAVVELMA